MATRFTLPGQIVLDASGGGEVTITARGDLRVQHTRVTVGPAPGNETTVKQPDAIVYVDGKEFESTHSGARDQSDTEYELAAGEPVRCVWINGDPGATATIYLRGVWL